MLNFRNKHFHNHWFDKNKTKDSNVLNSENIAEENFELSELNISKLKLSLEGLNGFYFLINDTNEELKQHFDKNYESNFNLNQFYDDLKYKLEFFNNLGIIYYYFAVPDKSIVCRDSLPFNHDNVSRNIDKIPNFIDFSSKLTEADYFKLDSHINYLGGKKLTYHLLNFIDDSLTLEKYNELLTNSKKISITHNYDLLSERNWSYSEEKKLSLKQSEECIIPIPLNFINGISEIPVEFNFSGVRRTELFKNDGSFSELRALIFRDSSTNILKWFLSFYFKEILFYWDHGDLNKDVINYFKPDIIIELRTERLLENIPTPNWVKNREKLY